MATTTTATLALGEVLSTTTGAYMMERYANVSDWAWHAFDKMQEFVHKRASKEKIDATSTYQFYAGERNALLQALKAIVVDASGYTVSEDDADDAIRFEAEQINRPPVVRFDDGDPMRTMLKLRRIFH